MDQRAQSTWTLSDTRAMDLDRPCVVCIVNVTPDSFADGGVYNTVGGAVDRVRRALDDGADMIDLGGESTRPGAGRVDAGEQIRRVVPVIEEIRKAGLGTGGKMGGGGVPISIDTTVAAVAEASLDAGADVINDVSAMTEDEAMVGLAVERGCGVVLMHRLRSPERDLYSDGYVEEPVYKEGVVEVVGDFLGSRRDVLESAGVGGDRIVLDPGLGFGKSVADTLRLIRGTGGVGGIWGLGCPVMSGLSRKSFVGRVVLGRDSEPGERVDGTVGMSVAHLWCGARVFRVHDVAEHRRALDGAWAVMGCDGREIGGVDWE